ncbi:hypothetical protein GCK72_010878 [Caenorhabditis remanei]|uniref:RING-type domain-containing protein n=1 Tax=Caenorhabditis remanei TaxID=31234 RepID=A0A6A5H6X7_CAERE|nr:hypothetical protein GCK72_010878 [Caenorhabditis remanei]KAF1762616.1 hypothetical protein GCK72_010878 [Caenorhabditis remanei]
MEETIESMICPLCGAIYDMDEYSPRITKCNHSFCLSCLSNMEDLSCPVCGLENGMLETNANIKMLDNIAILNRQLEFEDEEFIEQNVEKLLQSLCSSCQQNSPPRICKECAEQSGTIIKQTKDQQRVVTDYTAQKLSNFPFFCDECANKTHGNHETVTISKINNLFDFLQYELVREYLTHEKTIVDMYSTYSFKYRDVLKQNKIRIECGDGIDETFGRYDKELVKAYKESRKELEELRMRESKLILRQMKLHEESIKLHIIDLEVKLKQTEDENQRIEIKDSLKRLKKIEQEFIDFALECSFVQLTERDIEEIDNEIIVRMEALEAEYKKGLFVEIELEKNSKFYKFQAIRKAINALTKIAQEYNNNCFEVADEEVGPLEERKKQLKIIALAMENTEAQKDTIDSAKYEFAIYQFTKLKKFYEIENLDECWECDKSNMDATEITVKIVFLGLMHATFFPTTPGADVENLVYESFLKLGLGVDDESYFRLFLIRNNENSIVEIGIRYYLKVKNTNEILQEKYKTEGFVFLKHREVASNKYIPLMDVLNLKNGWLNDEKCTVEYGVQVESILGYDGIWKFNFYDELFDCKQKQNMISFGKKINSNYKSILHSHKQVLIHNCPHYSGSTTESHVLIPDDVVLSDLEACLQIAHGVKEVSWLLELPEVAQSQHLTNASHFIEEQLIWKEYNNEKRILLAIQHNLSRFLAVLLKSVTPEYILEIIREYECILSLEIKKMIVAKVLYGRY